MSVIVARVGKRETIAGLRKALKAFTTDIKIFSDEQFRDMRFAELIEEGKKSGTASETKVNKALKKRGIKL